MADWPKVPESVVAGVTLRWPDRTHNWAATVEIDLHELCAKYDATPRMVLPARYGFVIAADTPHGGLVFRSSPDPDGPRQAQVAAALAGLGVSPAIHENIVDDLNMWTVMDEVKPGTPLAGADPEVVKIEALAVPFAAMRNQPAPAQGMPSLFDWLRSRLEDDNLTELPPWAEPAPPYVRREALKVLESLARDAVPALCHGDSSTWNILASGPGKWFLIDPRGISGEVAYDVAVLASKIDRSRKSSSIIDHLSVAVEVDPERVRAWTVISSAARV